MTTFQRASRGIVAAVMAVVWLGGDAAPLLAKRGLEPGVGRIGNVGRIGDPDGIRSIDNRVRHRTRRRVDFWDEAEDEHQQRMALGIVGGLVVGALIAKPPKDAKTTEVQGEEYYYDNSGNYYKPQGDQYEVVSAPSGAVVNKLPEGAKKVQVGDEVFFTAGDIFYRPTQSGSDILFEVVPSPF